MKIFFKMELAIYGFGQRLPKSKMQGFFKGLSK